MTTKPLIRNVALVAHVDHGKTSLVDCLLSEAGVSMAGQRVMDSIDQERERGITIRSKTASIVWKNIRINLIDTPGHADFAGEVERVMQLADGVLLLVDAAEGPMPQTRFVLAKALEAGCQPVVVINKADRPDRRLDEVLDAVLDLFISLDASDEQLDFEAIYTSAKEGWACSEPQGEKKSMAFVLDQILEKVPPPFIGKGAFCFQVANLHHDAFVGRVALGKVLSGVLRQNERLFCLPAEGAAYSGRITRLNHFEGLQRVDIEKAEAGDIVEIAGFENINISDTLTTDETRKALPALTVEEPTLSVLFRVNDGPFASREGKPLTGRQLRQRLEKEILDNVALRFEATERADTFKVKGRGLLHLSVLIETMRREGSEFLVGPPRILMKEGQEPWEDVLVEAPQEVIGKILELISLRRGQMENLLHRPGSHSRLEAFMPSRALIGLRTKILNLSRGEATLVHVFRGWGPWAGDIVSRQSGSMISMETGQVNAYALDALDDRGQFFVTVQDSVYRGMIIGESNKEMDVELNPCKARKISNMRSSSSDRSLKFSPPRVMSLEDCLEFVAEDEWVEVTPKGIRLRKDLLDALDRKRQKRKS
jgi:GTP-binding protein